MGIYMVAPHFWQCIWLAKLEIPADYASRDLRNLRLDLVIEGCNLLAAVDCNQGVVHVQ
jgi:hypothetical protein